MESTQQPSNGFEAFRLYWAGNGELRVAYWGFGVVGSFILSFLSLLGLFFVVPFADKNGGSIFESTVFQIYFTVVLLVLLAYQFIVWVLIWRNADNTSHPIWSQLAKAAVALSAVFFLYELLKQI